MILKYKNEKTLKLFLLNKKQVNAFYEQVKKNDEIKLIITKKNNHTFISKILKINNKDFSSAKENDELVYER
ncbi:hypothetical protein [Mesomycoplasma neurolyticum]|nr:hypothetical protein [Mesomycoplasma neurolyticum]VEU59594.1 Uncharacterised protein [Mesomycoplasma neurolyticum]VEU59890.1 Uncharacterised protein [Mesomycoplasma neurolyticum]